MKRTKFSYEDLGQSEKVRLTNIEREIQTRLISIKINAYEIGKFCCDALKILPHGSYESWREQTFGDDLPYSTSYFYRRIYETFRDHEGQVQYIPTKYLTMLTQKQFPEEALTMIKEKMDEDPEALKPTQLEEVKELYTLMKKGTIGGNSFGKQTRRIIELGEEMMKNQAGRSKQRIDKNMRRTMYFGLGDILDKLDYAIEQAQKMAGYFPFDPDDPEHRKIIKQIQQMRRKLQKLEIELQGGDGLLKPVSTKNGTRYL